MSRVPRIRFKGFEEDWEQRKLGEILSESREIGHKGDTAKKITVKLWGKGVFEKKEVGSAATQYYVRHTNQFIYSKLDFLNSAFGVIPKKLDCFESTADLPAFDCNDINPYFLYYRVTQPDFYFKNGMIADGSRKAKRIHSRVFLNMELIFPNEREQQNVVKLLQSLDHLITLHQRKLEKLKIIKKSMLENLFPKNGEKTPRIRFSGFTEDWEQRKLGEVAAFSKGCGYSKSDLKDSGVPVILYGRLYTNYETVIKEVDTFIDSIGGAVYSKGGEIITPSSGETSEDISIASVVEKSGILLGGDLNIIYPQNFLDSIFIAISISNGKPHKDMAKRAQGKSVVHLHNGDLAQIEIDYPSIYEQTRISSYFQSLDHLITLHQSKLEKLQKIKKSMLESMFI